VNAALTMMLAEGEIDARLLVYGVLVLLSIIGGIFQKKKSDEAEKKKPKAPPARPAPKPPPPQPPKPVRTAELRPVPTPLPPRRAPAPTPVRAKPATKTYSREEIERRRRAAAEAESKRAPEPIPRPAEAEPRWAPSRTDMAGLGVPERLRRMVDDRHSLQAGLVLSEILAPPLALRDQERFA
jgi:hypothetical protein